MSEEEIAWDLSEVFTSCDDPKISKTMEALLEKADLMIDQYKGKINIPSFTDQNLRDLLEEYENISARRREIGSYSANSFNANMSLPETKVLWNKFLDFKSAIFKKLAFIELEIGKLVKGNPELLNEKILSNYTHYLEKIYSQWKKKQSCLRNSVWGLIPR